jgi:hypothetical protein
VVVVDVVVFVAVALAGVITVGHGYDHGHDLLRLSWDEGSPSRLRGSMIVCSR